MKTFGPIGRQELVNVSYPFIPLVEKSDLVFGYYNFKDKEVLCKALYKGEEIVWTMGPEDFRYGRSIETVLLDALYRKIGEKNEG